MKGKSNVVSIPVRVSKTLAERLARMAFEHDRTIHQEAAAILRVTVPALDSTR